MKIQIASDLHLEFSDYRDIPLEKTDADVLILAGDIQVGVGNKNWFFQDMLSHYKDVIYIAGNHEYYNNNINQMDDLLPKWASAMNDLSGGNFHFLQDQAVTIEGVQFLGSTLWSDFNSGDFACKIAAKRGMNDFRIIKKTRLSAKTGLPKTDRFSPNDAYARFLNSVEFIKQNLNDNTVVITHQAPSEKSIAPEFTGNIMNGAYFSNLETLVDQAKVWVHGHVHVTFDYQLGDGRVICNPRGYVEHEVNSDFNPAKVVVV
jgi:Icc-related predicted phosphoesterase